MSKVDPNFAYDMFKFLHKPIRDLDRREGGNFVERFLLGPQSIFEDNQKRIDELKTILDPSKTRPELLKYLKDHVGFTKELNNITNNLDTNDLRKLISLAVALWKQKGTEPGYINIVRLFTGKSARVFNWFDFRWIIGETQFGESQLGDDPFLISSPGVFGTSDDVNDVVALFTFENNAKDRSITRNHGTVHGLSSDVFFFLTPNSGFPQDSEYYARFISNVISVPNTGAYDFSGDLTVEAFMRTTESFTWATLMQKRDNTGKGWKLEINTATNELRLTLQDGSGNTTTLTHAPASVVLNDGALHHIAFAVQRSTDSFRLFVDGTLAESSSEQPLPSGFGDMTNNEKMFFGGSGIGLDVAEVDMDNFRMSLNAVYAPDTSNDFPVPLTGFIEFQEEQLDEFQTDIRIVDEGDLNKTLILRILNLMRPTSERLNVIFVRFFDDFLNGIGQFERVVDGSINGQASVNEDQQMELEPSALFVTDVLNDDEFQDIVLQINANDVGSTGSVYSIVFFFQDADNFYEYRIDTVNKVTSLHKTVGGVSSQIGSDISEDIVTGASYFFTVNTSFDPNNNETQIQTFVDGNRQHEVLDSSFEKGKFGIKSGSSKVQVTKVEMLQLPVDVRRIGPGFDL